MHPNIAQFLTKKVYIDYNEKDPSKQIKEEKFIGSASIVKMLVPNEILDELNIDPDIFSHVYLLLTCAHNVVYKDLQDDSLKKFNEYIALVGK